MKFDETLFYKQVAEDLIEFVAYHEGDQTIILYLLRIGYTPQELQDYLSFREQDVEEVVKSMVEYDVRDAFGLNEGEKQ
jgi:hypothetical protein